MLLCLSTGSSRKCIFKIWEGLGPSQFLKYSFLELPMLKNINMIPDYYIIILLYSYYYIRILVLIYYYIIRLLYYCSSITILVY